MKLWRKALAASGYNRRDAAGCGRVCEAGEPAAVKGFPAPGAGLLGAEWWRLVLGAGGPVRRRWYPSRGEFREA